MKRKGFTLVELAIVLVIVGLLAGGVLSGQSLIRAAELRSVSTDFERYTTAVMTFRDKYLALPGDMVNATQFWTSAGGSGSDSACVAAQTTSAKATCNGNSNGQIGSYDSSTALRHSERFTAWKHLANAILVEGSYSGRDTLMNGDYNQQIGINVPAGKITQGFFDIVYEAPNPALYAAATAPNTNVVAFYGNTPTYGILKPEEAWNIDVKMDDGSPVTGRMFANKKTSPVGTNCASSDADNATYDFTQTDRLCNIKSAL